MRIETTTARPKCFPSIKSLNFHIKYIIIKYIFLFSLLILICHLVLANAPKVNPNSSIAEMRSGDLEQFLEQD